MDDTYTYIVSCTECGKILKIDKQLDYGDLPRRLCPKKLKIITVDPCEKCIGENRQQVAEICF